MKLTYLSKMFMAGLVASFFVACGDDNTVAIDNPPDAAYSFGEEGEVPPGDIQSSDTQQPFPLGISSGTPVAVSSSIGFLSSSSMTFASSSSSVFSSSSSGACIAPTTGIATGPDVISNFEDGSSQNIFGDYWYVFADNQGSIYGNTEGEYGSIVVLEGDNCSKYMAGIVGITMGKKNGDVAPYVDLGTNIKADLSSCTQISYDYKGAAHRFIVTMMGDDDGKMTGYNVHKKAVPASYTWTTETVQWTELVQELDWGTTATLDKTIINTFRWEISGEGTVTPNYLYVDNVRCVGYEKQTASSSSMESSSSVESSSSSNVVYSSSEVSSSSVKQSSSSAISSSSEKSSSSEESSSSVSSSSSALSSSSEEVLIDSRDGQTYRIVTLKGVKYGYTQVWMAENLNYAYNVSTTTLDSSSFCYDNDPANCAKYGRLYLWSAAMDSADQFSYNGHGCGYNTKICLGSSHQTDYKETRGVCPEGWHIPGDTDIDTLKLIINDDLKNGYYLKSATNDWVDPNTGKSGKGLDYYGFTVLPAGFRNDLNTQGTEYTDEGRYAGKGTSAYFWTSSPSVGWKVFYYWFDYEDTMNFSENSAAWMFDALSVRCMKNRLNN